MSDHAFVQFCRSENLPEPEPEFRFHPVRKWRFDFAWPVQMVALEVEGGIWMRKGAHNTGKAILRDIEKYNTATIMGWKVLRTIPTDLYSPVTIGLLKDIL